MKLYLHLRDGSIRRLIESFPEAEGVLAEFVEDGKVVIEVYTNSKKFRLLTRAEVKDLSRPKHERAKS